MDYYELTDSTDLDLAGHIPQVDFVQIEGRVKPYYELITYFTHLDFEPVLKGIKMLDAKFTDLMSCSGLSPNKGLLVDEKFYDIARQYQLPGTAVYLFNVYEDATASTTAYKFLHIIKCEELKDVIDYSGSSFYFENKKGENEPFPVSDWDHWWNSNLKQVKKGEKVIKVKKMILRTPGDKLPGLVRMPFSVPLLVSQKLKDDMEANNITGAVFEKQDLEIVTG